MITMVAPPSVAPSGVSEETPLPHMLWHTYSVQNSAGRLGRTLGLALFLFIVISVVLLYWQLIAAAEGYNDFAEGCAGSTPTILYSMSCK